MWITELSNWHLIQTKPNFGYNKPLYLKLPFIRIVLFGVGFVKVEIMMEYITAKIDSTIQAIKRLESSQIMIICNTKYLYKTGNNWANILNRFISNVVFRTQYQWWTQCPFKLKFCTYVLQTHFFRTQNSFSHVLVNERLSMMNSLILLIFNSLIF